MDDVRKAAGEIAAAIMAACDRHGPIAPNYGAKIVEPFLRRLLDEAEPPVDSAHWRIEVDDETGKPYWTGAGAADKERSDFDPGEPLTMNPDAWPPGTTVVVTEPWDPDFYRGEPRPAGEAHTIRLSPPPKLGS